ncbi:MAG: phosphoribosylformylglycinamidine cyclo-ligase [Chitinophagaceae bacterium]|nr:MAG: phosphoribosylformylglycinamidine cyclo-ligase [Chitinophagaceae bacterium]
MSLYNKRGVSAQKEEVHAAIQGLDQGIYPNAFCKIYSDYIAGDDDFVNVMHADGAGTKSILAYLYWKETGDISVWRGIAQDAVVMNLDDLLCIGIYDNIIFNSTIDRNKGLIPGEVLKEIINGTSLLFDSLEKMGVRIKYLGGETADVGDVVRTVAVNGTMTARWPKNRLITNDKIAAGDVIVGLASYGQAVYESEYNSGIGSNGLTSARHDMFSNQYAKSYPESFDPALSSDVVYLGKHTLTEEIPGLGSSVNAGKLVLSPTRTFAPVIKDILEQDFDAVHGLIHCSGGGQTKCLKYLPSPMKVVKDSLFDIPPVFNLIQEASKSDDREMLQVFNMGCRMEIYTSPDKANSMIAASTKYGIEAKIIGHVDESATKSLDIHLNGSLHSFS